MNCNEYDIVFRRIREEGDLQRLDNAFRQRAYDDLKGLCNEFGEFIRSHWQKHVDEVEATGDVVDMLTLLDFNLHDIGLNDDFSPVYGRELLSIISNHYGSAGNSFCTLAEAFDMPEFDTFFIKMVKTLSRCRAQRDIICATGAETVRWIMTKLNEMMRKKENMGIWWKLGWKYCIPSSEWNGLRLLQDD